jgi:polysaccharide export outer membrane protein
MNIYLCGIAVLVLCLILIMQTGCVRYLDLPSGTVKEIHSSIVAKKQVTVPAIEPTPPLSNEYIIGVGDVLSVSSKT